MFFQKLQIVSPEFGWNTEKIKDQKNIEPGLIWFSTIV
jgi:hypothetical protein